MKRNIVDFSIASIAILANIIALMYQFIVHELPCPLCLLQRAGMFGIAFGAVMNLKHGKSFKYDFVIVTASLFSFIVALRQVFLHILPGNPGYGSTFLGLHFYTWNGLISFSFIIFVAIAPLFKNINMETIFSKIFLSINKVTNLLIISLILLSLINLVAVYLECGFSQCPDNPITYKNHIN